MPNENINRAIKRGAGEIDGSNFEEMVYEGYGPNGVAVLLEIMTDNRNRTASDIRYIFSKNGGNLGETGCVNWMFDKKGLVTIDAEDTDLQEDDIMLLALDAGAEDMSYEDDTYEIYTDPNEVESVREKLEKEGLKITSSDITMIPQSEVALEGKDAQQMLKLMDMLEDHDDVQNVYANFDISDEVMEKLS